MRQQSVGWGSDDSIDQCKKAIKLDPNAMWLHAILAWAYASKGMYSQAITEYEKMGPEKYAVSPENQLIASGSGWVYAIAGRRKDAVRIIEDLNTLSSGANVDPILVAAIYAGLDDRDRAFELLEKSYRGHSSGTAFLKEDPFWEDLRLNHCTTVAMVMGKTPRMVTGKRIPDDRRP